MTPEEIINGLQLSVWSLENSVTEAEERANELCIEITQLKEEIRVLEKGL